MDNQDLARELEELLGLKVPPVALIFSDVPLPGVPRVDAASAAGCAYWKRAAKGELFYTTGSDHLGCAIGAHTHGAELGAEDRRNLMATIGMMTAAGYLSESEIPAIPRRTAPLEFLTYGPLASVPRSPDLVLVRGSPRVAMLLGEAEHAAGTRSERAYSIRPACAMVPEVLASRRSTASFGCIGNRVYTELPDEEVWCALSGHDLPALLTHLRTLTAANRQLEAFHRARA